MVVSWVGQKDSLRVVWKEARWADLKALQKVGWTVVTRAAERESPWAVW